MEIVSRENEAMIAQTDYQVYALALIHGIDKKVLDTKMEALGSLRDKFVDTLTGSAYDYNIRRWKKAAADRKSREEAERMEKVAKLGKK